jgi:hypothetical protein
MTTRATAGPTGIREGQDLLADITAAIGRVVGSVTEVGAAMTALAAAARAGRNPLRRADLAALRPLVAQVLARHRGFAAGASRAMRQPGIYTPFTGGNLAAQKRTTTRKL